MSALTKALEALDRLCRHPMSEYAIPKGMNPTYWQRYVREGREAHAELKAYIEEAPKGLETTLMNAVKPHYKFHATCGKCGEETETDNGEWLIWCGNKKDAQNLIDSTRHLLKGIKDA